MIESNNLTVVFKSTRVDKEYSNFLMHERRQQVHQKIL